jgi:hypothetical protein
MKKALQCTLLAYFFLSQSMYSQTKAANATAHAGNAVPARTATAPHQVFIQWNGLKGMRSQIFLDVDEKSKTGYCGSNANLGADLMLEMPGDGSVTLMRYTGNGDDWKWTPVEAHALLSSPVPETDRIEFDAAPLGSATKIAIQFRSLDKGWQPVSASKIFQWHPN